MLGGLRRFLGAAAFLALGAFLAGVVAGAGAAASDTMEGLGFVSANWKYVSKIKSLLYSRVPRVLGLSPFKNLR